MDAIVYVEYEQGDLSGAGCRVRCCRGRTGLGYSVSNLATLNIRSDIRRPTPDTQHPTPDHPTPYGFVEVSTGNSVRRLQSSNEPSYRCAS
jgi:hypothetical protein